jgi:predicted metal-dependent hydrolase
MEWTDAMKAAMYRNIQLGGRRVDYSVVRSRAALGLRLRVGPNGVEVVQPPTRTDDDVFAFVARNEAWILDQLERVERLRGVRRPVPCGSGEILFRGHPTRVRVEVKQAGARRNAVDFIDGEIVVHVGSRSQTSAAHSLESWLRKQARAEIVSQLAVVTARLRQRPNRLYVMGQRTKWGSCSSRRNLSFNWRLILAPEFVLRYLVTHEAVHLAIPDHSAKFWLTVHSHCPETERAKQWLCSRGSDLMLHPHNADCIRPAPPACAQTNRHYRP